MKVSVKRLDLHALTQDIDRAIDCYREILDRAVTRDYAPRFAALGIELRAPASARK